MGLHVKVTVKNIRPAIWRRLHVSGDLTLEQFHEVLQITFGWTDSHLHQFIVGESRYALPSRDEWGDPPLDERRVRLKDVAKPKGRFQYDYDFGDGWEHQVVVERVLEEEPAAPALCIGGKRACPPEDCGGPWGYAHLVEIIANPEHPEYEERLEWLGDDWHPEEFDVALANQLLGKHGPRLRQQPRRGLRSVKG